MKMRTCLAVVLAVALFVGGFSASAFAACYKIVRVIRVYVNDTVVCAVYGQDLYSVLPGYTWYWYISNDDLELLTAAQNAYDSGTAVAIQGDAASCPTTGPYRYGGYVNDMWMTGR